MLRSLIYGETLSGIFQRLKADKSTRVLCTIDYAHHEIHSGNAYFFSGHYGLGDGDKQEILITTPDSDIYSHFLLDVDAVGIITIQLYEESTRTGTTEKTPINRNRNSSNTARIVIHEGATGGAGGNLLLNYKSGVSTGQAKLGTSVRNTHELILKKNTKYLLVLTSGSASNLVNAIFNWYEHQDQP